MRVYEGTLIPRSLTVQYPLSAARAASSSRVRRIAFDCGRIARTRSDYQMPYPSRDILCEVAMKRLARMPRTKQSNISSSRLTQTSAPSRTIHSASASEAQRIKDDIDRALSHSRRVDRGLLMRLGRRAHALGLIRSAVDAFTTAEAPLELIQVGDTAQLHGNRRIARRAYRAAMRMTLE